MKRGRTVSDIRGYIDAGSMNDMAGGKSSARPGATAVSVPYVSACLLYTSGDYVISHFDAYHKFEPYISDIINNSIPKYIQSLDSKNISSEAIALNCAFVSGIIADFLEDTEIVPTVSGRMGSGKFSFTINDIKTRDSHLIDVENSQIEIDAAYEGLNYLALFEAKRDLSEDFLVRQLYLSLIHI